MYQGDNLALLILVTIIGAAFSVPLLRGWLEDRRYGELCRRALSLGFTFSRIGPAVPDLYDTGLELLRNRDLKRTRTLATAQVDGAAIKIFDFFLIYQASSHARSTIRKKDFTGALISCSAEVPVFRLVPKSAFGSLRSPVNGAYEGEIPLPHAPELNRKFRLTGPDELKISMFFSQARADWFGTHPGLCVEGGPGWLLFWNEGLIPTDAWHMFTLQAVAFAEAGLHK